LTYKKASVIEYVGVQGGIQSRIGKGLERVSIYEKAHSPAKLTSLTMMPPMSWATNMIGRRWRVGLRVAGITSIDMDMTDAVTHLGSGGALPFQIIQKASRDAPDGPPGSLPG